MLRRLLWQARGEAGQSMVEFALVLPIFLAVTFGAVALVMGFQSKVVVTDTARAAGRYMSIHCDPGSYAYDPDWPSQTLALVERDLRAGALPVGPLKPFGGGTPQKGQWWVEATCQNGAAYLRVQYAAPNLFPPLAGVMGGEPNGPMVWTIDVAVQYPTE